MGSVQRGQSQGGFIIAAASYVSNSAGHYCLFKLCEALRRRGFPAFVTIATRGADHIDAPVISEAYARQLCERGFAAIYPETIPGNQLHARTVIRWVLNRPGLLGGDEVYDDEELVFCYSEAFKPYVKNRVAGMLHMPTIDTGIFHSSDWDLGKRSLECFYVGKSKWKDGVCDRHSAFEITRKSPPKRDLGKILRASRVLYCFDNSTILTYEALLCGCPVIVVPDGTQTREDYDRLELGRDGISWGPEEFCGQPVDVPALRGRYAGLAQQFDAQLTHLIEVSGQEPANESGSAGLPSIGQGLELTPSAIAAPYRRPPSLGRRIERRVRAWRKRLVAERGEAALRRRLFRESYQIERAPGRSNEHRKRPLACAYLGRSEWRDGVCDREHVVEVCLHRDTTAGQLVSLLSVSRVLYCFEEEPILVRLAGLAKCPVVIVSHESVDSSAGRNLVAIRAA